MSLRETVTSSSRAFRKELVMTLSFSDASMASISMARAPSASKSMSGQKRRTTHAARPPLRSSVDRRPPCAGGGCSIPPSNHTARPAGPSGSCDPRHRRVWRQLFTNPSRFHHNHAFELRHPSFHADPALDALSPTPYEASLQRRYRTRRRSSLPPLVNPFGNT